MVKLNSEKKLQFQFTTKTSILNPLKMSNFIDNNHNSTIKYDAIAIAES